MDVDKVVEFLYKYTTYKTEVYEKIKEKIKGHFKYKTCKIFYDNNGAIYAVCLWNVAEDLQFAHVTDLVIREDYRNTKLMWQILSEGLKIWPVKYLKYDRDYTNDGHNRGKTRMISVEKFLRRSV